MEISHIFRLLRCFKGLGGKNTKELKLLYAPMAKKDASLGQASARGKGIE